jgi:Na+-transporting NADH:ubiquinone oxidoreductase subunit NqrF
MLKPEIGPRRSWTNLSQAGAHLLKYVTSAILCRNPQILTGKPALTYRITDELLVLVNWETTITRNDNVETKVRQNARAAVSMWEKPAFMACSTISVTSLDLNLEPVPNARFGIYNKYSCRCKKPSSFMIMITSLPSLSRIVGTDIQDMAQYIKNSYGTESQPTERHIYELNVIKAASVPSHQVIT